jgi:hypothetical protein
MACSRHVRREHRWNAPLDPVADALGFELRGRVAIRRRVTWASSRVYRLLDPVESVVD